jgi:AbrB family looped-hinge helix DNA binding protein
MNQLATTKLSSKGQVVIPEEIREKMQLHTGDQFIVIAEKDVVILKVITCPDLSEYSELIGITREVAKKVGLTKKDIKDAIVETRKK